MKWRWIRFENTRILLHLSSGLGQFPEWHPVGQVTLRQVYENQAPAWYAWVIESEFVFLGSFETSEQATLAAERANGTEGAPTS